MKRFYCRFRLMLLTLALGLASVPFIHSLSENYSEMRVELPTSTSESPLYVLPKQVLTQPVIESRRLIYQERDLSVYDFGGQQSDCGGMIDSTEKRSCKIGLEKSREFILNHWQTKTKGYIELESTSIDAIRDSQIFIEPDKNDSWHIVWMTKGWNGAFNAPSDQETVYVNDISSVKLKRATEDNYQIETGIRYLSFLDKENKEVEGW